MGVGKVHLEVNAQTVCITRCRRIDPNPAVPLRLRAHADDARRAEALLGALLPEPRARRRRGAPLLQAARDHSLPQSRAPPPARPTAAGRRRGVFQLLQLLQPVGHRAPRRLHGARPLRPSSHAAAPLRHHRRRRLARAEPPSAFDSHSNTGSGGRQQ